MRKQAHGTYLSHIETNLKHILELHTSGYVRTFFFSWNTKAIKQHRLMLIMLIIDDYVVVMHEWGNVEKDGYPEKIMSKGIVIQKKVMSKLLHLKFLAWKICFIGEYKSKSKFVMYINAETINMCCKWDWFKEFFLEISRVDNWYWIFC